MSRPRQPAAPDPVAAETARQARLAAIRERLARSGVFTHCPQCHTRLIADEIPRGYRMTCPATTCSYTDLRLGGHVPKSTTTKEPK